jgi:NRE family putative nickel resistance protein-like MFS transporter
VSNLGAAIAEVALPLFVYDLTGSASLLGLVFVISLLPKIVLAPIAGMVADRLDRRTIMLTADLGRMLVVAVLPFAQTAGQVAVIAFLIAVGSAFGRPAESAAMPMVAGKRLLLPAISLAQVSLAAVRVIGPAVGAGIVGAFGPAPAFWIQAFCFAASVFYVSRLQLPAREVSVQETKGDPLHQGQLQTLWGDVREEMMAGLRMIGSHRVLRSLTMAEVLWQAAGSVLIVGMVAYTEQTLDLGAQAGPPYALITATFSAGTVVGALIAPHVERRFDRRVLMGTGYFGPLLLVPLGAVPPLPAIFGCFFLFGLTDSWLVIAMQTTFAETVPDRSRGRFFATWGAIITLSQTVMYGVLGVATERLGPPTTVMLVGLVTGIGCSLIIWLSGSVQAVKRTKSVAVDVTEPPVFTAPSAPPPRKSAKSHQIGL